ncbi:hypothetical protein HOLleu_14624 [Holothuria leucospilota]|uniref:Uncharacterized protein n=1 Tax=Holothuria leucospilota TaxID=206669 RepID=A0A9Q1C8J5_HOLLE|nr:hypothetical protein HOLleu_14624 [Holothuria leucospilota]
MAITCNEFSQPTSTFRSKERSSYQLLRAGNDEVPFSPPPPVSPEGYIALTLKISNYSNNYVCSTVPADMLLRKRK